jgi:leucyl/phenylalanyl-tRNA--protein transferase
MFSFSDDYQWMIEGDYTFPHPATVDASGVLSMGGKLDAKSLFIAYAFGIFPWYNHRYDPVLWWSPVPRFVMFPDKVKVHKSMRSYFNGGKFTVTYNRCFEAVIRHCEMVPRKGQLGTWINEDIIAAFSKLHDKGLVISTEVWQDDVLVGGLYGMYLGKVFYGESMFSRVPNASKFGFICLAKRLQDEGCMVIDCQQPTEHLASLGGEFISKGDWFDMLAANRKYILSQDVWLDVL